MELRINEVSFPEAIEFNFEELKQELAEKVQHYNGLVYTDDQIKEAKADRAQLKKFVSALSDERIKVKKQCLKPYEAFEKKVNELTEIVMEPITVIDKQVKEYEEKQKQDKLKAIQDMWCNTEVIDGRLTFNMIFNEKWLNASVSMKSIQTEMEESIKKFNDDMATLANLHEFGFEAQQVYISTLDMNKAISEGRRLSEIQKQKAAYEAEQERLKAEEATKMIHPAPVETEVIEKPKTWVKFAALMTVDQAMELRDFLNSRHIEFKSI